MAEKRDIGLKAIRGAQEDRRRGKATRISGPVWLAAGGVILLGVVLSWFLSGRALGKAKDELLAQQRAAVKTVGAEWLPLRDKLEAITVDAAGAYKGDLVTPEAATWDFRSAPGLYLRLRVDDAKDAAAIRKNASGSLRDGFTACLLHHEGGRIGQIARGDDAGSGAHDQPWNLRQAYTATRVLGEAWVADVEAAGDDLRLRVFQEQYEKAKKEDIPFAIDVVKKAKVFLLLLDEDVPEAKEAALGDAGLTEALQQVPHPVRVHVVNLETGNVVARLRKIAHGEFMIAGERAVTDPEARAAMKRQVNNCALAQDVSTSLAAR